MRDIEDILINKAAVCIIDNNESEPFIPTKEMELTEVCYEYFDKHIMRCFSDEDSRPATFQEGRGMLKEMLDEMIDEPESFTRNAGKIARLMKKAMSDDEREPSADLVALSFECKKGVFIALMKFNFAEGYTHTLADENGEISIKIEKSALILPGLGQKIQKTMIYNKNEGVFICDKDKDGWFINGFARLELGRDGRTNLKSVRKAVEVYARKAYEDNADEGETFRRRISERLRRDDIFDVTSVAESCIEEPEKKELFTQTIKSTGIDENRIVIDKEWAEKKFQRKRLKVDKNIDLYIDVDTYNNKDRFFVKKNGDGTVDIVLKNIRNFTEK